MDISVVKMPLIINVYLYVLLAASNTSDISVVFWGLLGVNVLPLIFQLIESVGVTWKV